MKKALAAIALLAILVGGIAFTQTDTFDDMTNGVPSAYDPYVGRTVVIKLQNDYRVYGTLQSDGTVQLEGYTYTFNWDDVIIVR